MPEPLSPLMERYLQLPQDTVDPRLLEALSKEEQSGGLTDALAPLVTTAARWGAGRGLPLPIKAVGALPSQPDPDVMQGIAAWKKPENINKSIAAIRSGRMSAPAPEKLPAAMRSALSTDLVTRAGNAPIGGRRAILTSVIDAKKNPYYVWSDTKERDLSSMFRTREEAIKNAPKGYKEYLANDYTRLPEMHPELTRPQEVKLLRTATSSGRSLIELEANQPIRPETVKAAFFPNQNVSVSGGPTKLSGGRVQRFWLDFYDDLGRAVDAPAGVFDAMNPRRGVEAGRKGIK